MLEILFKNKSLFILKNKIYLYKVYIYIYIYIYQKPPQILNT
jgi:hypothetical protein